MVSTIVSKAAAHNAKLADEDVNEKDASHEDAPEPSATITEETTPSPKTPELRPHREYRTPWDPTDHGRAMRDQLLRPPPQDPWNPS